MPGTGFDVVVVGGGPAGAVVANRLSAEPDRSVLLIEAGPDYGSDEADWPDEYLVPQVQPLASNSWGLEDAGSGVPLPRAKMIGGSSAINACYWIRGSAVDYDEWAKLGNPGWSFDDLLPYFRMAESDPLGGPLHGTDGPIRIARADELSPVDRAFTETAASLGLAQVEDINGDRNQVPSVGPVPKNIADGHRLNASLTYLAQVRQRSNLTIRAETLVDRVRFDGERAVGVTLAGGEEIDAGTVVLAAGAYFTPGILNRSGYGDEGELAALDVPVRQHLPGIGQNLRDHPFVVRIMGGMVAPEAEYSEEVEGQAMARSRSAGSPEIDCHIYNAQRYDAELERWTLGIAISMVTAHSTGTVSLTSSDPETLPRIEHRHYTDPGDLERMCDGVEMAMEIFTTAPLSDILEPLEDRTVRWADRDALRALVPQQSITTNHCSGTTKMGLSSDPTAVTDQLGRVYGSDSLVVADSSLFPTVPRGNIHFAVVAVAEKIAAGLV